MPGKRTSTISFLLLAAAGVAAAQRVHYFPLMTGNQWVYRVSGTTSGDATAMVEVGPTSEFHGRTYFLLHDLSGKDYWVRTDDSGTLVAYDPDQDQESAWYPFESPEGQRYRTSVPGNCCGTAQIASHRASYKGPVGEYDYALEVLYFPGIVPGGLTRELFLPWIGMISRSQFTSPTNLVNFDLIYAHIGATVVAAPEISFALSLDQSVYTANLMPPVDPKAGVPLMTARLTLRNTTPQPVELSFPSGQVYDLVFRNEKGDPVFRWSDGRAFIQIVQSLQVGPGERNWMIQVPLNLPAGKYAAEAWLTTAGAQPWRASAGFELRQVF